MSGSLPQRERASRHYPIPPLPVEPHSLSPSALRQERPIARRITACRGIVHCKEMKRGGMPRSPKQRVKSLHRIIPKQLLPLCTPILRQLNAFCDSPQPIAAIHRTMPRYGAQPRSPRSLAARYPYIAAGFPILRQVCPTSRNICKLCGSNRRETPNCWPFSLLSRRGDIGRRGLTQALPEHRKR